MNILGIDIGGTKTAFGIITEDKRVEKFNIIPTKEHYEEELEELGEIISEMKKEVKIDGIGIGLPGPLDPMKGIVFSITNLEGWRNIPLKKLVEEKTGIPVFIDNDANAAAVGELYFGKGRGLKNFVVVTLGTGIGGGLIIDGKLYRGAGLIAGEVGHIKVELEGGRLCGCGKKGCVEAYASGKAILEIFREIVAMKAYTDVDLQNLSTKTIFEAAKQGDILARKVIYQAAKYLGMAMSSLVNILNPEAIIFSGGLSKEKELLVEPASKIIMQRAISEAAQSLKIETTELGREGPVLGAAALFLESMHQIS